MSMFPTVHVLLSTFNGERYLVPQLDSLVGQKGVRVQITVRDDGSADATKEILERYAGQGRLKWYGGQNLRPAQSFMHLLRHADRAEYYAFADQDDVWDADKLRVAVARLERYGERPALYIGQTRLVDAELHPLPTPALTPRLTLGEAMVYAFASGCTFVMNDALRRVIVSRDTDGLPMLHDFWCYLVAQAVGAAIEYDVTPHISYRQHEANVVGLGRDNLWARWRARIERNFLERRRERSTNVRYLLERYGDSLRPSRRAIVERFAQGTTSPIERICLLFDERYRCGDTKTWVLFKIAVLLNTY